MNRSIRATQAICLALAREGADLVVADRNLNGAKETTALIKNSRTVVIQVDVSNETSVKSLYAAVMTHFGKIDIVVNSAGICRMIPILEIEVAEWDKIMAVNLRGTFLMGREAFRLMKKKV